MRKCRGPTNKMIPQKQKIVVLVHVPLVQFKKNEGGRIIGK